MKKDDVNYIKADDIWEITKRRKEERLSMKQASERSLENSLRSVLFPAAINFVNEQIIPKIIIAANNEKEYYDLTVFSLNNPGGKSHDYLPKIKDDLMEAVANAEKYEIYGFNGKDVGKVLFVKFVAEILESKNFKVGINWEEKDAGCQRLSRYYCYSIYRRCFLRISWNNK